MKYAVKNYLSIITAITIIAVISCFYLFSAHHAEAATTPVEGPNIKISINQQNLDLQGNIPLIYNDRILLPVRIVFEKLNASVNWDNTTKTATATMGTDTVIIKLNSNTAYNNGTAITLDTSAIAHKDRIYIPLRFVGESFGNKVVWDNNTKTVSITEEIAPPTDVDPEPAPPLEPVIKINGKQITLTKPLYNENNITYVFIYDYMDHLSMYLPPEYFFSWSNEDTDLYTILFDGTKRELYPGQDYYLLNGEKKSLSNKLITVDGETYIPLGFSKEVLGGTISYEASTNTTNISINRPKFKSEFLKKDTTTNLIPSLVEEASMLDDRILSISDNPEVLSSQSLPLFDNSIIMQTNISSKNSTSKHRVFGWHINKMDKRIKIGIVIENTGSNNIKIEEAKVVGRTTYNTWVNYDVGLPLAEALLSDQMSNITPSDTIITPGNSKLIHSFTLNNSQMVGFILDMDLARTSGSKGFQYQLRVVVSTDDTTNLKDISGDDLLVDTINTHPRGTWKSTEIYTELPIYDVSSPEVSYSLSNGITDNIFTKETSLDPFDQTIANIGHFGVVYKVRLAFYNDQGQDKTVRIRLCGRGGNYACAVKTPNGVFITPILKPHTEVANVYDFTPAPGISHIDLQIVHAGGSDLPVAVNILTL
ncbi:MAG: copper amine oxidase N-terminal domain-containing protein [Bacillota bacterium]|jgi:hypothetical protein